MNKKLRLVITDRCPNKCPMCCNNRFDLNSIPVFDRLDYEEISITGGEPMICGADDLCHIIATIRRAAELQGHKPKIWLYTSRLNTATFPKVLHCVDGICYTPHSTGDVASFKGINRTLNRGYYHLYGKSLRLNLFSPEEKLLEGEDLSNWQVKHMEWIKDCPIPEGEDFRRIANLL